MHNVIELIEWEITHEVLVQKDNHNRDKNKIFLITWISYKAKDVLLIRQIKLKIKFMIKILKEISHRNQS